MLDNLQENGGHNRLVRPNIVIIVAGQVAGADFPDGPADHLHMPHLRRLSQGALRFTRALAPSPDDAPARAAILTGRMPLRSGLWRGPATVLGPDQPTLGHILRQAGYFTVLAGDALPLPEADANGFDLRLRPDPPHDPVLHDDRATELSARFLAARRAEPAAKPWCLMLALRQPQAPYAARRRDRMLYERSPALPAAGAARAARQGYFAALSALDDRIGLLQNALGPDAAKTLFVVTASTGLPGDTDADPLSEPCLRVPLIVQMPHIPPMRVDAAVSTLDLVPTLARATGLGDRADALCDGLDLIETTERGLRPLIAAEKLTPAGLSIRMTAGVWDARQDFCAGRAGELLLTVNGSAAPPNHPAAAQVALHFQQAVAHLWPAAWLVDMLIENATTAPWLRQPAPAALPPVAAPAFVPISAPETSRALAAGADRFQSRFPDWAIAHLG